MSQETTLPPEALASADVKQPSAEDLAGFSFPDQTSDTTPGTEVVPTTDDKATTVAPTEVQPPVQAPETKVETKPTEVTPQVSVPARFDNETDLQYNLRVELFQAGQAKANATTEEEKGILAQQIKGIRKAMGEAAKEVAVPETTQKVPETVPAQTLVNPSEEEIAKAQLRKLGFVTEDQIETELAKRIEAREAQRQVEMRQIEHATAAKEFYDSRPDLTSNPALREQFEQYVVSTYLSKMDVSKLSKRDFAVMLEQSANYAFPKPNTAKKAEESQSNVDLVNFSGGSKAPIVSDKGPSKDTRERLKNMGWSDTDIANFKE